MRFTRRAGLILGLLALAASPAARALFDPEITHTKVGEPRIAAAVDPALARIGTPMSLAVAGARLVVGGSRGVAALDAAGKLLWLIELPPATVRQVAADEHNVAFTSFDFGGVDRSGAMASSLLAGELMAKPEFVNASVGLADADGKLLWTVASVEQGKLAPPALSSKAVGVVGIKTFALYDRTSGKPLGEEPVSIFTSFFGLTDGLLAQWPSRAAVVAGDVFHVVRNNFFMRVDNQGEVLDSIKRLGMLSPLEYLPAGPVMLGGRVFFANEPSDSNKKPQLVAGKVGGGVDWDDRLDATVRTGMLSSTTDTPMDIAVSASRVFVATNFSVFGYSPEGKSLWRAKNGKGGLFPSALRGARYIGNGFERKHGVPKTFTAAAFLAATDERVVVATSYTESESEAAAAAASAAHAASAGGAAVEGSESGKPTRRRGDALTVLNANDGSYVESLWFPEQRIYGLVLFGEQLAVATSQGLKLLVLK